MLLRGRKREKVIRALVGTGSSYVVLNPGTAAELGLLPMGFEVGLTLADGRRVAAKLYVAEAEVLGRREPVFVAELDVPVPLLRVFALETLGLKPNPLTGELEVVGSEGLPSLNSLTSNPAASSAVLW